MREIVLDTETTGLDPAKGDRLVEIAGVELINSVRTGAHFHCYINPERDMPEDAFAVHGLSASFLSQHRVFRLVAAEFLAFVGEARLVIHNAEFDMRFINAELLAHGHPTIAMDVVIDTLALARRRHPGAPASLDALCQRYRIDNTRRVKHGALIDAEILAEVYAELLGGRQITLGLQRQGAGARAVVAVGPAPRRPQGLPAVITTAELAAHAAFIESLGPSAIWNSYALEAEPIDRQLAAMEA